MEPTSALAEQLRLLTGDPRRAVRLSSGLDQILQDVTSVVPSCTAVSVTLVRPAGEISLSVLGAGGASRPVCASLAVPLAGGHGGDVLILRSAEAGAFLLLADDLGALLPAGSLPLAVDQHLDDAPVLTDEVLVTFLADTHAVDQAVGVLLDQGLLPETALQELGRRAASAGVSVVTASRVVLASTVARDVPEQP